jgi:hypothetical protein
LKEKSTSPPLPRQRVVLLFAPAKASPKRATSPCNPDTSTMLVGVWHHHRPLLLLRQGWFCAGSQTIVVVDHHQHINGPLFVYDLLPMSGFVGDERAGGHRSFQADLCGIAGECDGFEGGLLKRVDFGICMGRRLL